MASACIKLDKYLFMTKKGKLLEALQAPSPPLMSTKVDVRDHAHVYSLIFTPRTDREKGDVALQFLSPEEED